MAKGFAFNDAAIDIITAMNNSGAFLEYYNRPVAVLVPVKNSAGAEKILKFIDRVARMIESGGPCLFCSGSWSNHSKDCPGSILTEGGMP